MNMMMMMNVIIVKDCVLCEVRSKFVCNLNESLFPSVDTYLILFFTLSFILMISPSVLTFSDYRYFSRHPDLVY